MKSLVVIMYLISVLYVHLRGRVRLSWWRQLLNHSTLMAPVNAFVQAWSKAPGTPYIPLDTLPELAPLQLNWRAIRAEAEQLMALKRQGGGEDSGDPNFDAFARHGWGHFYLKWYGVVHASARRLCPHTFALLQAIPSVKVATFAELPPGARIAPHRDLFAGWVRYHLGLATPGDDSCYIMVDGRRHRWSDGRAMIFDETYLHWAVNDSPQGRLILVCDVERPMRHRWAQALSHLLGRTLMTATSPPHEAGAERGLGAGLSRGMIRLGHYRRRLKAWNRSAYRATLIAAGLGLGALVYWL